MSQKIDSNVEVVTWTQPNYVRRVPSLQEFPTVVTGECFRVISIRRSSAQARLVFELTCSRIRFALRQILDNSVNQETQRRLQRFIMGCFREQ